MKQFPSLQQISEVLHYEQDGRLIWDVVRGSTARPGVPCGTPSAEGRLQMSLFGLKVYVADVVWFIHHGYWPRERNKLLDHINSDRSDNRIENLRLCTKQENSFNRSVRYDNKLGIKGVSTFGKKFKARIMKDQVSYFLGSYDTKEEAAAAYRGASVILFGEFAHSYETDNV